VISYDDFNPYLDNCKAATGAAEMDEVLEKWRLEDHMDAILSLSVTKLVDLLTAEKINLTMLSVDQRRDLLLLAALYDASTKAPIAGRWSRLRRQSGFRPLWTRRDLQVGFGTTLVVIALIASFQSLATLKILPWLLVPILAGWLYWGLAADPGGMVCPRHSQGPARAQPRPGRLALGAALVQAVGTRRPASSHGFSPQRRRAI